MPNETKKRKKWWVRDDEEALTRHCKRSNNATVYVCKKRMSYL